MRNRQWLNSAITLTSVMLGILLISLPARSEPLQAMRTRYEQVRQAWDKRQMAIVQQLMPTLRDYPLYPYLQYRQLTEQLTSASAEQINTFVQQYPTLPATHTLISRFMNELARREDWQGLLAFSPQPPASATTTAQCNYYTAQWHTGQLVAAWQGARTLWLNSKQKPAACQALFAKWQASGDIRPGDYQQRILQAVKQGDWQQVETLNSEMLQYVHPRPSRLAGALQALAKKPDDLLTFARNAPVSHFQQDIIVHLFSRTARKNPAEAMPLLNGLINTLDAQPSSRQQPSQQPSSQQSSSQQSFSQQQPAEQHPLVTPSSPDNLQQAPVSVHQRLKEALAWQLMGNNISSQQARWRDEVISHSHAVSLIERRVRLALASNDRPGLRHWLAHLPADAQQKDEWQYWQAIILQQQNQLQQARQLLVRLTRQRGFYPMLAAQQLAQPYPFKIDQPPPVSTELQNIPALARIKELKYWQQDNTALGEWRNLLTRLPAQQQAELAHYADSQHWWTLSVQATIIGKLWDHLTLRFPPAWQALFTRHLADKTISQSYAMAIARQESAWNPQVHSPAGAIGLMQLMPATAKHTAKKFHITDYRHTSQLENPAINIELGTQYLQEMYQQFDNNRILAAAAYNAGPNRVRSWLASSAGTLNAIAFIESIPFTETRGYVKNVLAYDAYYRQLTHQKNTLLLTHRELAREY